MRRGECLLSTVYPNQCVIVSQSIISHDDTEQVDSCCCANKRPYTPTACLMMCLYVLLCLCLLPVAGPLSLPLSLSLSLSLNFNIPFDDEKKIPFLTRKF